MVLLQHPAMSEASSARCILDWLKDVQLSLPGSRRKMIGAQCRGIPLDKLPLVLRHGIDSDVPFSPFNVGALYKASEYTSNPGAILFYDDEKLDPTFREVAVDIDPQELARLGETFQTRLVSADGKFFWFSRFPAGHHQLQSAYEHEYARWIPGNPFDALISVWIVAAPDEELRARCLGILDAIKSY